MTEEVNIIAFDPFQQMMERPIPKPYKKRKLEEDIDVEEIHTEEIDTESKKIELPIVFSSKNAINREEILERLRKTKNWITRCDVPLKYTEDSDYEFENENEYPEASDTEEKEETDIEEKLEYDTEKEEGDEIEKEEEIGKEEQEIEVEEVVEEEEPPKKKGKKEPKEKKTKNGDKKIVEKENIDLAKVKLGEWEAHLPKPEKRIIRTPFYLNNRKKFIQKLNDIFAKYRLEINDEDTSAISCKRLRDSTSGDFVPLMHQKVVKDYLNLYTPYRGVLLYHGLGAGKTANSIAIAEGFKTEKRIFVMLPASLKTNYWVEIQKAGDPLYKKNQYWEFVDKPELFPMLAKALSLTMEEIRKRGGAWMVDIRKPPNYETLLSLQQAQVDVQIQEMIQNKYMDIHYNAPNLKKIIEELIKQKNGQNPFHHTVVIIDEAHNFISRIVGKLKISNAIFSRLYHLLMDAEDCRIVLLSGTPIINYPHEMAVMFNLLRGYIKTWTFKVVISTNKEVNQKTILTILENAGLKTYDFVQYANNKLIITRNPFGFSNVIKKDIKKGGRKTIHIRTNIRNPNVNAKTRKQKQKGGIGAETVNYQGVLKNPDYMTNPEFIKTLINVMANNGVVLKPGDDTSKDILVPKLEKALYDNPDKFRETFIEETISEKDKSILLNVNVLKNRLLGLTSYFRSAQEKLLPNFVLDSKGEDIHVIEVPMSDYQLGKYALIRKEEYEKESKAAKRKKLAVPVAGNGNVNAKDLFSMASSYRIFSRASCNFVFPENIDRPRPPSKFTDEEKEEDVNESVVADGDEDVESEIGVGYNYQKDILETMATLKKESKNVFAKEKLKEYSPKFLEILNNIQDLENDGLHLVYSNFRTLEGIGIFQMVLEENGMEEFKLQKQGGVWAIDPKSLKNDMRRYVLYTGTETEEQKEVIRNIYNGSWETLTKEMRESLEKVDTTGKRNSDGLIIQVFMITSAGAEGINLRNTRFVHIMEPYWHNVRLEQVIGRARRICSHEDLPQEKRTVKVFVYLSVMSELQKKSDKYTELRIHDVSKLDAGKPITTDENLFEIAGFKTKINSQFLKVIKETAIDCSLYVAKHNEKEKTPLVCYGYGKVNSNEFASHPILETDLKEAPVGQEVRIEKFKGKVVTVNGIKYALNPGTNELYNLVNYKNKILTFEGMYDPLKQEVAMEPVEKRPVLKERIVMKEKEGKKNDKMMEVFDLGRLGEIDVKENRINVSLELKNKDKYNSILLFFPTRLRPSFFPFVTNEKEVQLFVKTACNINPPSDNYDAKYNRDKFESPVYQNMQKKSILTTIDYVFEKMKMGVYVRICNNVLTNFMPLYNLEYVNDFSQLLKFKNNMTAKEYFAKKDPKGRGKWNMDLSKWVATGCLLRNEADDDSPTLAYLSAFYDMLTETCHSRKVTDCVFLLNRKDFPYLDKTWNESFTDIYGENVPMQKEWKNQSFVPILSQSTSDRHADIPIPTGDDWNNITQKYFADKMKEYDSPFKTGFGYENVYIYDEKKNPIPAWEKRKPVFFWRGMGTGCGNSVDNNPRLKLTQLSQQEDLKSILDAGITKFTRRDKKVLGQPYVEYTENTEKLVFKPRVERFDQLNYKFTLNVEGNSAAYRFGSLFKFGYCILNIKSQYKMWFEPFLEDMVHCIFVEHDLSNLEERMKWCLDHDAECRKIAENARAFYDKYFTKDFVFDYLADIFNKTAAMIGPNYQVDEQEKIRRKNDKKYTAFEFIGYNQIIGPEMNNYKDRYKIQYNTFLSNNQKKVPDGTLIVVPFRENKYQNRAEQLQSFIRYYSVLGIPILIVTQSDDGFRFNRGKLLNIGFHYTINQMKKKIDTFIFHDVDLLLPNDFVNSYYGTKSGGEIVHFGKTVEDYYDYPDFLGGVIQFSRDAFQKINGFPNHFYGWGGEDDALKVRIASLKYEVKRPDIPKMKAKMEFGPGEQETRLIEELKDQYKNEDLLVDESIWKMNGINSLLYKVVAQTTMSPGVFNITVDIH